MKFKVIKSSGSNELLRLGDELVAEAESQGHELTEKCEVTDFVLNLIDIDSPVYCRRKSPEETVLSITMIHEQRSNLKADCYSALVKSLSNMLFCISGSKNDLTVHSITPEVGFVKFIYSPASIYHYAHPVISSHFVLRNRVFNDLVVEKGQNVPEVDDIVAYARELKALGVLPTPFPLKELLNQELIDHLYKLFQLKGLSYGNLSIRNRSYKTDGTTFWMTARGVDKSKLKGIGEDVFLVRDYDRENGEMHVSVPSGNNSGTRVSVDAIEHFLVYREFPEVNAIVHAHAWIDGIPCTDQTYPCGTRELGECVVALLKESKSPGSAVIGLKNHGITITGPDIGNIFERIEGNLKTNIPVFS